jgi:hypothetical protein
MSRTLLALALVTGWIARAEAHQLDEYLQAARLGLSKDRIAIELDLTPGVSVAARIFAMIDADGNGRADPEEIEDYARLVLADLSLQVDDRVYPLTLTRAESPSWSETQEGMGRIRIEAFARMPVLGPGRHRVSFENVHQSRMGVYLVNALKSEGTDLLIRGQNRDVLQHSIDLDLEVTNTAAPALWLSFACVALTALVVARRRPRARSGYLTYQ